jgi:radical SAM protein with 4Fe4S-binding SPASM domain
MGACPVECFYCPQNAFQSKYNGPKQLSLDVFKATLKNIPVDIAIGFSGYSEPFANKDAVCMVEYAFEMGYHVLLFTTLTGLSLDDIVRLGKFDYDHVCLHLPDNLGHTHIPNNDLYASVLNQALRTFSVKAFSVMNRSFVVHDRAGSLWNMNKPHIRGPIYCRNLKTPYPVMLPNGDVHLCCEDFSLEHKIGNFLEDTYGEIMSGKSLRALQRKALGWDNDLICRRCSTAMNLGQRAFSLMRPAIAIPYKHVMGRSGRT